MVVIFQMIDEEETYGYVMILAKAIVQTMSRLTEGIS